MIQKLMEVMPFHDCFHAVSSGTEATENAVKIARQVTGKANIVAFRGGFHGRSLGMMSLSGSKTNYRQGFQPLIPGCFFSPDFSIESFENVFQHYTSPEETCAVIMEP